jgi:hypothetical protein
MSTDQRAAEVPRKRFQCITIDAESVIINGADFDSMTNELAWLRAEVASLRANADKGSQDERASAWRTVFERLLEIDPNMAGRTNSGLGDALSLINELAARPAT